MTIQFEKVEPVFLEKEKIGRSEVWNHSIHFQTGEKIQIVAPSGSGKTSFIHFIYGLRKDYSGNILFNNKNLKGFSVLDFAGLRSKEISVIFQDLRLFPTHSVWDNIEIKRQLHPFHGKERIKEMAERLGIGKKLDKPCNTCSYGEQQRIAIIRALQQPFGLLLMDEPFSHLDENNRSIAMQLINEEADKRNAAVILADLKVVSQFSPDKTLYL
jgi:putative ABC transport system ATP-binding protein